MKNDQTNKQNMKDDLMTEDQKKLAKKFIAKYKTLYAENQSVYALWDKCEAAYQGASTDYLEETEVKQDSINIIHPNIEGQVSALVEQNIATTCKGEGPSDEEFSSIGRILLDWCLRKNKIKRLIERHERRREKFGSAWFKVYFDPHALKGFGLATITAPSLKRVFVDGKIKDYLRLQEADYIIETMTKSIEWAKEEYGEEYANAIYTGIDPDTLEFSEKKQQDDDDAFTLLQVWEKKNGKLVKHEITGDGLYLPSKTKQDKPFYKANRYPYFITPLYPLEGSLYGMSDAELLMPLQAIINDLDDQINKNTRLLGNPITFIDPASDVDLDKITNEEGQIIPCNDPQRNILVLDRNPVSEAVIRRKNQVFDEAQRVTRFSDLMIGQSASSTATEANIQMQQGNSAVDHKKQMLQVTLNEVCEYLLELMMENYTEAKAFRITEDKNDFMWIDPRQLNKVPVLKPATDGYVKEFLDNNPDAEPPQWEILQDEEGKDITKEVEFDIEITIGAGLPKNKSFLFQLVKELAMLTVQGQPVLSFDEVRGFLKDLIDLPLEEKEQEQEMAQEEMPEEMPTDEEQPPANELPPDYNAEGQTMQGNPMTGVLPSV